MPFLESSQGEGELGIVPNRVLWEADSKEEIQVVPTESLKIGMCSEGKALRRVLSQLLSQGLAAAQVLLHLEPTPQCQC